ncbi:MAG TPA: ferritin-like domain-containing protein [Bacteroidales bacterium]|jgi:ferritin-like metal-binding protein YciE|nr:ferritin-like domain-containing protein [Bacteroidales bacterium]
MEAQSDIMKDSLLHQFLIDGLKDIYWAENKLLKAIPKMQQEATTVQLEKTLGEHLEITREQILRLDQIFDKLGVKASGKKCEGMQGLIEEGEDIIDETEEGSVTRDVGIIVSAQKIDHYEIAAYGGLAQLARTMGHDDVAELLDQTLQEEKEADRLLTEIAENDINYEASTETK